MTSKEIVKKGFELAQEELKEKQVKVVKEIVKKTLEKLDDVKGKIKELQEEKKILELDIDDLKEGRLDRIEERQTVDPKAKKVSVVVIIKEKEIVNNSWYQPYYIERWNVPVYPTINYSNGLSSAGGFVTTDLSDFTNCNDVMTINCSVAKANVAGAYDINDHIINLR